MSHFKSPLLSALQKKSRIFLDNIDEDALEEKKYYNRRQFLDTSLKSTLAIGMASSIPLLHSCKNNSTSSATNSSSFKPKVAIIGAGIAGLNAANHLKKSGAVDFVIYEGLKRCGGRMHTIEEFLPGITLDIGGEFVDTGHAEMLALIEEFKLEKNDYAADPLHEGENREWYIINGKRYTMKQVFNEFKNFLPIIEKDLASCGENYDTPEAIRLDKLSLDEYLAKIGITGWLKELLRCAYLSEFGLDLEDNSALNFIDMLSVSESNEVELYGDSDERYSIKGGVVSLINAMATAVGNIELEHKLIEINKAGDGYSLIFENGKSAYADFVIITIPFTVLRDVKFNVGAIAPQKLKAIKELGYGQNAKLFLGFDERLWRTKYKTIGYLFNDKIHNGWDSSYGQTDNKGAGIYTVFLGGKDAIYMAENKKNTQQFVDMYLPILDSIYPGIKNKYNDIADIAWWPKSKIVKGSYSAFYPGQWTGVMPYINEPIGNILFAGEHCSDEFQGFMNGGAQTGKDIALQLLKKIKAT
ncbi:MAG TPA: NAD(P)/FAD-dependent oxidoreductase [Chitinophagales bacterium]|nr:NAD(P)/FAD-dependent oxidoreductase [Chitinophagales bacterium]